MSCAAVSPAATTVSLLFGPNRHFARRLLLRQPATLPTGSLRASPAERALSAHWVEARWGDPASMILLNPRAAVPFRNTTFTHTVSCRYTPQPQPRPEPNPVPRSILLFVSLLLSTGLCAQQQTLPLTPVSKAVPGRLIVLYRNRIVPSNADAIATAAGARVSHHLRRLGASSLTVAPADETVAIAHLTANPQVAMVLHDRYVTGHSILFNRVPLVAPLDAGTPATSSSTITRRMLSRTPLKPRSYAGGGMTSNTPPPVTDTLYASSQGWAVRAAGGYGDAVPGGTATGPWNTTRGAGVRIAILDSGVDANHPDISPNLALNLSEVNQSALAQPLRRRLAAGPVRSRHLDGIARRWRTRRWNR